MSQPNNPNYYINPSALSFTPNYQGIKDIVYISIVSNAAIAVFYPGEEGLGYGTDAAYQRWRLTGYTTKLGTTGSYYIYARLSRSEKTAMVIFSVNDYNVDGSITSKDEDGNEITSEASLEYWYVKLGSVTASENDKERILSYDSGILGTARGNNETNTALAEMFEVDEKTGFMKILKTISEAVINKLTVASEFIFGKNIFTGTALIANAGDEKVRTDANIPTAGYVAKEIEALDEHFLIKDKEEAQEVGGAVTFKHGVTVNETLAVDKESTLKGGATFGEYVDLSGGNYQGAKIDEKGFGTFAGLRSKYFEIFELIYNIQTAEEGVKAFSDVGTIEKVEGIVMYDTPVVGGYSTTDEYFKGEAVLKMREVREGYLITFKKWDVVHGYVNKIGESGEYAVGGECWMRVVSVDNATLTMTVQIYADDEIPGGINILPTDTMTIARKGNKDSVDCPERQTSFYISTEEGNITQLMNVTRPKIGIGNIGTVLGVLPDSLFTHVEAAYPQIQLYHPYLYARGIIVQDVMRLDYLGRLLKQERYRGTWSQANAESSNEDERYRNMATTYDTVTYKGMLWQCETDLTPEVPGAGSGWLLKSGGADVSIYDLVTSTNVIYFHTSGRLSNAYLDIKVSSVTSSGTLILDNEDALVAAGLRVEYAIDGETSTRQHLPLYGAELIELEDGDGVIVAENDGDSLDNAIYLENAEIDIEAVKDNITLYLVDTTKNPTEDIVTRVIPVLRDGKGINISGSKDSEDELPIPPESVSDCYLIGDNIWLWDGEEWFNGGRFRGEQGPQGPQGIEGPAGKDGADGKDGNDGVNYSVQFDPPFVSHPVDPNDELKTIGTKYYTATCTVLRNGVPMDIQGFPVAAAADNGAYHVSASATSQGTAVVSVGVLGGTAPDGQASKITLTITRPSAVPSSSVSWDTLTASLPITYSQRGLVGEAGKEYPQIYMAGCLEFGKEYDVKYDETDTEKVIAQPALYYKAAKGERGNYYVLQQKITADENTLENLGQLPWWRPFENMGLALADAIMSPWARFGGENGAVFWGNFQFASQGVGKNGDKVDYDAYAESMFKTEYDAGGNVVKSWLTGEVLPNIFLDFATGAAKLGKLSESFVKVKSKYYADSLHMQPRHIVNLDDCHNVSVQPIFNTDDACVVVLPKVAADDQRYVIDGTHSTIIHEYNAMYSMSPADGSNANAVVAVVPDTSLFDPGVSIPDLIGSESTVSTSTPVNGWFIWRGYRTKFILITPGAMLKLRSCLLEDGGLVWFVENSSDFAILNAKVELYADYNKDSETALYTFSSLSTTPVEGSYRNPIIIGSPVLNNMKITGYDKGITTNWIWDMAGNLRHGWNGDTYPGAYICEKSMINL